MIQSLFLILNTGEVFLEKHWRGNTSRQVCDFFWDEVAKRESIEEVPPIMTMGKFYLLSVHRENMWLLSVVLTEVQPLLVFEFLHRIMDVFKDYFGVVDELSLKENFSTVYQLLEEMMDNGYPLTTEPNALKSMIKPPTMGLRLKQAATGASMVVEDLPDMATSSIPWRKTGVKYSNNEIFIDVIEEIDSILDPNGQVVSSEVQGVVECNCRLSGMPDLLLVFSDPELIDDCSFHPCVRYNRFERDKHVSFVPPDGKFELMRYRVNTPHMVVAPIFVTPQISMQANNSTGHVNITLGKRAVTSLIGKKKKNPVVNVEVSFSFPKSVRTADLNGNVGEVIYDEAAKTVKWKIGRLKSNKQATLKGTLMLQNARPEESPTLEVAWEVPMTNVSGLAISSLNMTNERYNPYKGVRITSRAGKFQVRTI
mmetsp:Transcript_18698/g.24680  ORF Transcript_18698/g.24680 Transcript_18698/m.24680 type:complete len:425 (+) Transcript_18698:108-1382(+)